EVVDLKETEVAVIILDAFLLQLIALLGVELIGLAPGGRAFGPALVINEERLAVMRALAIGPAGQFHLENAEIDAELQFLETVEADNFAHLDRTGFVRPILEQRIKIKTHYVNNVRNDARACQSKESDE